VGQCPTFGPESSFLWDSSPLMAAQSARDSHHCTEVDTPFAGYGRVFGSPASGCVELAARENSMGARWCH